MAIEIEIKLKVDDTQAVRNRLAQLGASSLGCFSQVDTYFDNQSTEMKNSDKALRLRVEQGPGASKKVLAFKGPKQSGQMKRRMEIQFAIDDEAAAKVLFGELGFKPALLVEKKRDLYELGGCEIAIDEVKNLGTFVEIEGPDEAQIKEVQLSLGLERLKHIPQSYACLLQNKLNCR